MLAGTVAVSGLGGTRRSLGAGLSAGLRRVLRPIGFAFGRGNELGHYEPAGLHCAGAWRRRRILYLPREARERRRWRRSGQMSRTASAREAGQSLSKPRFLTDVPDGFANWAAASKQAESVSCR